MKLKLRKSIKKLIKLIKRLKKLILGVEIMISNTYDMYEAYIIEKLNQKEIKKKRSENYV